MGPVCSRGLFSPLNPTTVSECTLRRKVPGGPFNCHMCEKACGRYLRNVEDHYLELHSKSVLLSPLPEDAPSQQRTPPMEAPSPSVQDIRIEGMRPLVVEYSSGDDDGDLMDVDLPSLMVPPVGIGAGGDFLGSQSYEESEWEEGSAHSDTSTEVLVCEDDDDVVPRSFSLLTPPGPSSDDDRLELNDQLPGSSSELEEADSPSSAGVYGSNSKHLSLHLRRLADIHSGLFCDHLLYSFGYALNNEIMAVICTGCRRGVPVDMLQTHSKKHHPGRSILHSTEHDQLVQHLSASGYRLSNAGEKYHQTPGQKPVDGLEVLSGFLCPLQNKDGTQCSMSFAAESTFARHLSSHSGCEKPRPSACVSDIQTLFAQGGLQCYFSVNPSLSNLDPSSASAYVSAVEMLKNLPPAPVSTSDHDKDRASVHWFTRWPELLKPYINNRSDQMFLQSLVSFPESGAGPVWLPKLRDHGCRWWGAAESEHIKCSFRASATLKSHQQCVVLFRLSPCTLTIAA